MFWRRSFSEYLGEEGLDFGEFSKTGVSIYEAYPNDNRDMMAKIYKGFMEVTDVGTFNFTNLLLCIYEADQSR